MTQTLTTERLKQIRHSFIAERDANADIGRPSYDEAIAIMDELLANREARPVKNTVLFEHSGCGYGTQIDMMEVKLNRGDVVVQILGNVKKVINEKGEQSAIIYTAPPEPAVQSVVDWRIDESTGAKILMYKDCSVIEDQQAEYVLSLIQAAAPVGSNG